MELTHQAEELSFLLRVKFYVFYLIIIKSQLK